MVAVIGVGAGGHAKVVIEILRLAGKFEIKGLLDSRPELKGSLVHGVPVLGDDSLLAELRMSGIDHAFIGVGTVNNTRRRTGLFEETRRQGFQIVTAIHPQSVVSPTAHFGKGATIMAGAVINAAARLGDNVIVNTGAIVEHDCVIGNNVHIATGARLAGNVTVEDGVHVGLGALVRQGICLGRNSVIGAGAVVVKDVPENVTMIGAPARIMEKVGS